MMCLAMGMLISVSSSLAMAQQEALSPPKTVDPPSGPKYVIYLVAVLLTAGVIFAATLRSKRSHQD